MDVVREDDYGRGWGDEGGCVDDSVGNGEVYRYHSQLVALDLVKSVCKFI